VDLDKLEFLDVEFSEGARELNECENLYADSIREIEELTLELVVTEAKPQAPILAPRAEGPIEALLIGGRPIESDATCRSFRLIFERMNMVSYSVLNESYGAYPEAPETFTGALFRVFSSSHLLEFIKRTTCASDEYPGGTLQHYEVACLNHVVDVICTGRPRIAVANPLHRGARRGQPEVTPSPTAIARPCWNSAGACCRYDQPWRPEALSTSISLSVRPVEPGGCESSSTSHPNFGP
jgi:hypothetical protein